MLARLSARSLPSGQAGAQLRTIVCPTEQRYTASERTVSMVITVGHVGASQ
jgi:hypothetical protein